LEEAGLDPVALDLTGSGIDHTDTNSIATLADYSKPLIDYLINFLKMIRWLLHLLFYVYLFFGSKQIQL